MTCYPIHSSAFIFLNPLFLNLTEVCRGQVGFWEEEKHREYEKKWNNFFYYMLRNYLVKEGQLLVDTLFLTMEGYSKKIKHSKDHQSRKQSKTNKKNKKSKSTILSCNKSLWSAIHCKAEKNAVAAISLYVISWLRHSRTQAHIPNPLTEGPGCEGLQCCNILEIWQLKTALY